ncbi:MAG: HAD-IC family P-type ATPase [Oscillospiraceae bacterium]
MNLKELLTKADGESRGGTTDKYSGAAFGFDLQLVVRLIVSCLLFAAALIFTKIPAPWPIIMLIAAALIAGYDTVASAALSIMDGRYFEGPILMLGAALIAFLTGLAAEAAALVLLYRLGGMFVDYASARTRETVIDAVSVESETAHVEREGADVEVPLQEVKVGDVILIAPGDIVPCDCIIAAGGGSLDASPIGIVGEPLLLSEGDEILAGCICLDGAFRCDVTAIASDSAAAALTGTLLSRECMKGDALPKALVGFLKLYPPIMLILAVVATGLIPLIYKIEIIDSVHRALTFIIVANPFAMVAAFPMIRFCAIGGALKNGAVFKNGEAMEKAADVAAVAFDKSGTLTDGNPRVTSVKTGGKIDSELLLKVTAHAMAYSSSPYANSVISAYGGSIYIELIKEFSETPEGVEVFVDNLRICVGSLDMMSGKGVSVPEDDVSEEMSLYVSVAEKYAGRIILSDSVRRDTAEGVAELGLQGVASVSLFTDEPASVASAFAAEYGIKKYFAGCGSEQIAAELANIKRGLSPDSSLMFVRGGVSAAHSEADIDVAMCDVQGLAACDADIALVNGSVFAISSAIGQAKFARRLMYMTLAGVALLKLLLLVLAFVGVGAVWFAVFLDSAAAVAAVLASILAFGGKLSIEKQP